MKFQLPQNTVFYLLEKSMKRYRKLAQSIINEAGYDISINQLILLTNLDVRPDAKQVELAELIFKDFASVARMVDLLVKKEFLMRQESKIDRRKKDLTLTLKCKNMLDELIPLINKYRNIALNNFSEQELTQMRSFLKRLVTNCEDHINQTIKES